MAVVFAVSLLWGYRKDKRQGLNVAELRLSSKRLYIGVFLDPIEMAKKEQKSTDRHMATTQQLEKAKKQTKVEEHYEQLDGNGDESMRNSILPPP